MKKHYILIAILAMFFFTILTVFWDITGYSPTDHEIDGSKDTSQTDYSSPTLSEEGGANLEETSENDPKNEGERELNNSYNEAKSQLADSLESLSDGLGSIAVAKLPFHREENRVDLSEIVEVQERIEDLFGVDMEAERYQIRSRMEKKTDSQVEADLLNRGLDPQLIQKHLTMMGELRREMQDSEPGVYRFFISNKPVHD